MSETSPYRNRRLVPPKPMNHSDFLELAHLQLDGELSSGDARALAGHLAGCKECQSVQVDMASLSAVLDEIRVEPHPDFSRRVLENLPSAAWEMRRPAAWRVAAIAFVGLLAAAWATTLGSEPLGEAVPWIGPLVSIAELIRSSALAGAGLLTASWSGVALAVGQVLSRSTPGMVAFGVFVLGIDCLFLRYLWRLSRRRVGADRRWLGDRSR